jgi:hypothetical protein
MMLTIVSCAFAFAFFLQKKHTSHLNKSYQEIFGSINTTTATVHRVSETVTQLSRCTQNTAKCAIESTRQVTTAVIQSAKKATTAVIETSKQTVSSIYEEYQTGRLRISFESLAIGSLLLFLFVGFLYIGTIISEKRIFSSASS